MIKMTAKKALKQSNSTGLPDNLKTSIETLAGYFLDDVKAHENSAEPVHLRAQAYTEGTAIHLAAGQEKYLTHEAWHVVQQKQGKNQSIIQIKGDAINDDVALEKEADSMGKKP
jgi:hypothetical protein